MGRQREFDERQVLAQATRLFWREGYAATTYEALYRATGVTARSLINAFGDKEQLFRVCLTGYLSEIRERLEDCLNPPGSAGIVRFFAAIAAAPPADSRNQGCLIANLVPNLPVFDEQTVALVREFRRCIRQGFAGALRADRVPHAEQRAQLLGTLLWGASAEIRLQGSVGALAPLVEEVERLIDQWRCEGRQRR